MAGHRIGAGFCPWAAGLIKPALVSPRSPASPVQKVGGTPDEPCVQADARASHEITKGGYAPSFMRCGSQVMSLGMKYNRPSAAIINRLAGEMRKSLSRPETVERMRGLGALVVSDTPAEFAAFLRKDNERWERVIKASGVKAE